MPHRPPHLIRPAEVAAQQSPHPPTLAELADDPQQIETLPVQAIPLLLCQLQALQANLTTRLLLSPPPPHEPTTSAQEYDRLLTAEEAAARLGVTARWLYDHAHHLPFTRRFSRKCLRFSEDGLQRWKERQQP